MNAEPGSLRPTEIVEVEVEIRSLRPNEAVEIEIKSSRPTQ
jgi:hypothetical protein